MEISENQMDRESEEIKGTRLRGRDTGKKTGRVKSKECREISTGSQKKEVGIISNQEILLLVFGITDCKILTCYRVYGGSARSTQTSERLLKGLLSECMEEVLLNQYERGMALFCLIAEGLPGNWSPMGAGRKRTRKKRKAYSGLARSTFLPP